jgi:hypothetical protein
MKNIHLIPTDKPSRLGRFIDTGKLSLRTDDDIPRGENINIYITVDEEIKEGDWLLVIDDFETYIHEHKGDNLPTTYWKKIILTTDQDLIKDGVQEIDEEYLVWFVNNPSCESVEIDIEKYVNLTSNPIPIYKIIIPQEEPKQIKCYCGHTITCDCEPLQETIEEAAEMYIQSKNPQWTPYHKQSFKDGVKWQQEQDKNKYSEEEVRQMFNRYNEIIAHRDIEEWQPWIEKQFKKKFG